MGNMHEINYIFYLHILKHHCFYRPVHPPSKQYIYKIHNPYSIFHGYNEHNTSIIHNILSTLNKKSLIILQIPSFPNVSHDAKSSRSHIIQ